MAVNKNFVVKNGLEVNNNLIFADATNKRVGIASTTPNYTLNVAGGIGVTDAYVSGFTTFSGAIIAVVAEAPHSECRHGTGNTGCKHYLITMNDNYSSLEVSGISIYTAGGGTMGQNTIGKIEKVSGTTNQWRLWFKKGSNYYTTYVRGCTIKGIY